MGVLGIVPLPPLPEMEVNPKMISKMGILLMVYLFRFMEIRVKAKNRCPWNGLLVYWHLFDRGGIQIYETYERQCFLKLKLSVITGLMAQLRII